MNEMSNQKGEMEEKKKGETKEPEATITVE